MWAKALSLAAIVSVIPVTTASASIVLQATRVIYQSNARDATIGATNSGAQPLLVQVWLDSGDMQSTADSSDAPYVVTPPLFRLDGGASQSLRLIHTQSGLPSDRESVHWLNVLGIPPENQDAAPTNSLRLIMRTRIKVFYRPTGLEGKPMDAAAKVKWSFAKSSAGLPVLRASNPTPYHVSFSGVTAKVGGRSFTSAGPDMVAPMASVDFALTGLTASSGVPDVVEYTFINDYGASVDGQSAPIRE